MGAEDDPYEARYRGYAKRMGMGDLPSQQDHYQAHSNPRSGGHGPQGGFDYRDQTLPGPGQVNIRGRGGGGSVAGSEKGSVRSERRYRHQEGKAMDLT